MLTTLTVLSVTLFLLYSLLMILYRAGWRRQAAAAPPEAAGAPLPDITVIIPARDEAANIGACIRSILNNRYQGPAPRILVIDDFSSDDTAAIASECLANTTGQVLPLARYLSPGERLNSYKKKALEIAIGEATGEWIVTTDADCIVPEYWLSSLACAMRRPGAQFIAAPVSFTPFSGTKNTCYYFQSLDFMTMQGITAASVPMNLGNMCNGANLAFRKEAFYAVDGYRGIDHIASGDDMMLMYKIRQRFPGSIRYVAAADAIVQTPAQPGWRSFLNQRIRWSSKADKYDERKLTLILLLVYLFNLHFLLLAAAAFADSFFIWWITGMLFAKIAVECSFLAPVAAFYGKTKELLFFPVLQPLHILYIVLAGFLGKFGSYRWKGRKVK